jgi:cyclopropane fatty-acyl-phospholipid synthase-like methyltransferase
MSSWNQVWQNHNDRLGPRTTSAADAWVIAENVVGALQLGPGSRLLDWGCGPAHACGCLTEHGIDVLLYDRSRTFAAAARERFADSARVTVLDEEQLGALEAGSLDAILLCSVLQYLGDDEIRDFFSRCARLLQPSGALVLIDVLPQDLSALEDLRDVVHADIIGAGLSELSSNLGALSLSAVRRLRHGLRLRRFSNDELCALLAEAGLSATRCAHNFKPSRSRQTWIARPVA